MKKRYVNPEVFTFKYALCDILTASGGDPLSGGDNDISYGDLS